MMMQKSIRNISINKGIIHGCIALLIIWRTNYCLSAFVNDYFTPPILIALFVMWMCWSSIIDKTYLVKVFANSWMFILFIFINIMLNFIVLGSLDQISINYIVALIVYCISIYYSGADQHKQFKKFVILVLSIDLITKMIYSLYQISINPAIVRQMSTAIANENNEVLPLMAEYATAYLCAALGTFLFSYIKNIKSKALKILVTVITAFVVYFVFKCSIFFAIIIMVYSIIAGMFIKKRSSYIISPIIVALIILIFKNPLGNLFFHMANSGAWNSIIQGKLNDLSLFLRYGEDSAYMTEMRIDLMYKSIAAFFERPLFGTYSLGVEGFAPGRHSEWLDLLANFGIIRLSFFIGFLYKIVRGLSHEINNKSGLYAVISVYAIIGIVNPIFYPQTWVMLLIIMPFTDNLLYTQKKDKQINDCETTY